MGLINSLVNRFGYDLQPRAMPTVGKGVVGPLRDDWRIWRSLSEVLSAFGGKAVTQPYKQSVWVYTAVNAIATNISRVPFILKQDAGPDAEPTRIETGQLYDLFTNPNPFMTQQQLFDASLIFLGLYGECFWIMENRKNVTEIPTEIWTFNPRRFEPAFSKDGKTLVGWYYVLGVEKIPFSLDEVIYYRYFNPYDDIRGLSPLEAGASSVDQDYYANQFNSAFFKNGASVGGFVSVEGELTDESFNRLIKQFDERHKGASKAHKIAVVEGGGKFTEAKITQKDMDFIKGKNLNRKEILALYKVNEVIVGEYGDIKSYEGIKAAHKAFWEECLMPKVLLIENILWSKFFSKIWDGKNVGAVWGEFDLATVGALQVNFADRIETAHKMFNMGWPINAINRRLELGMPDMTWGNEWFVPGGFTPVSFLLNPDNTAKPKPDPAPAQEKPKPKKEIDFRRQYLGLPAPDSEISSALEPIEEDFASKLKKFIFLTRKNAIEAVYSNRTDEITALPKKKDAEKLQRALENAYTLAVIEGEILGGDFREGREISEYPSSRSKQLTEEINTLMTNFLSVFVKYSAENELSNEDLVLKLRELFNIFSCKITGIAKKEVVEAAEFSRKRKE
jgi:HK97 family phage portal protein